MYTNARFQLIGTTSDFRTKFAQNYRNDKNFVKINVKFEIRIWQCMPVPNFSQFRELQFLGPHLPKKHFRVEYYDK